MDLDWHPQPMSISFQAKQVLLARQVRKVQGNSQSVGTKPETLRGLGHGEEVRGALGYAARDNDGAVNLGLFSRSESATQRRGNQGGP